MRGTLPPQNPAVGDGVALRQISEGTRQALHGNIDFQSTFRLVPKEVTFADTPYDVMGASVVLADATDGAIVINLPPADVARGFTYLMKKADSGAHTVTLEPDGSETIDGAANLVLSAAYAAIIIYCNGVEWFTLC